MAMLETPARIWRRIEEGVQREDEMPSLPSLPAFETSGPALSTSESEDMLSQADISLPLQSTPSITAHSSLSNSRAHLGSASRFAASLASRSMSTKSSFSATKSRNIVSPARGQDSFDISRIPSLPNSKEELVEGEDSLISDPYLSLDDEDDATHPMETAPKSFISNGTSRKSFDASLPPRTDLKASPFRNISMRRPYLARLPTRTPSLSRDSSSSSSSANTTPRSNASPRLARLSVASPLPAASVPLPRSNTASPAVAPFVEEEDITDEFVPRGEEAYPPLPEDDSMDLDGTSPTSRQRASPFSERYLTNKSSSSIGQNDNIREPTFSSEDTPAMTRLADDFSQNRSIRSLGIQSPAPSSTFSVTPIPARPRARFATNVQPPPDMDITNSEQSMSEKQQTISMEESIQNDGDNDGPSQHGESEDSMSAPTPIPAKPRARFTTPSPDEVDEDTSLGITPMPSRLRIASRFETPVAGDQDDVLTPRTRRKSFLLSVIHSNARPRPKAAGTPHPHGRFFSLATPRAGSTPYTRAPRSISQQPDGGVSESEPDTDASPDGASVAGASNIDAAGSVSGAVAARTPRARSFTGGSLAGGNFASPYESDRASYISTASSHDLTIHARANASFDAITVGQQGGLNRMNASKLNQYLYSLNTRLKEENEELAERLRLSEMSKEALSSGSGDSGSRRLSAGGRRRSSVGGSVLGDVEEELSAEMWAEEKRQLEEALEELKEELQVHHEGREQAEAALQKTQAALEDERNERSKDKEKWRSRMSEVEAGVSEIIKDLEKKMHDVEERAKTVEHAREEEAKTFERKLRDLESEKGFALDRAEKAERFLENKSELGGDLKAANERLGQAMSDAHDAAAHIAQLEDELAQAKERISQLETEQDRDRVTIASLEQDAKAHKSESETVQEQLKTARAQLSSMEGELRITKEYVSELEGDASKAVERMEAVHGELEASEELIEQLRTELDGAEEQFGAFEDEKDRATELARQLEEALEAAETKMKGDETNAQRLQDRITTLERELERERQRSSSSSHRSRDEPSADAAEVEALEDELDAAHREIARLSTLLQDSPARAAINKAKDLKIELLEKEKEDLLERVQSLKSTSFDFQTPSRASNSSGISPLHRQLMTIRTWSPKTPGPVKEFSTYFANGSVADQSISPLIDEISRLQHALDEANKSVDDKLDKLEEAGIGVVGLTKKLEDARSKIILLEDEVARLSRREDRHMRRLERMRCPKCLTRVNLRAIQRNLDESSFDLAPDSLPTNPPTPPSKTSDGLRKELQVVNTHLKELQAQWREERKQWLGEKAVLEDAARRLNSEMRHAKEKAERNGERSKAGIQEDLDKAQAMILDLEAELRSERAHLREMNSDHQRAAKGKEEILLQLQRTEQDMTDIREQLQRIKKDNHELESELRQNINAEQKARLLEAKVFENMETIEQLRHERSVLSNDYKELQRRYSKASGVANKLRSEHAASQVAHDKRRHELDIHLLEVEDLREALATHKSELQKTESDRARIAAQKEDIAQTIGMLEADLRRVRKDAETFGRDLRLLRAEKENATESLTKAERAKKQAQSQIRVLKEQIATLIAQKDKAEAEISSHVCSSNDKQLEALKLQHNKECKGLFVQIRFLKAKHRRESLYLEDAIWQKNYLLVLLSKHERSEQTIISSIAKIGFPVAPAPQRKRKPTLKKVALAVRFLIRVQHSHKYWSAEFAPHESVIAAYNNLRRGQQRRAITSK